MKLSLQFKLVVLFSTIVFVGLSAMLLFSYKVTENNMYRMIHDDMLDVRSNLDIAMNQYFLVRNKRLSVASLAAERTRLVRELGSVVNAALSIYTSEGKPFSSSAAGSPGVESADLAAAVQSVSAYITTISEGRIWTTMSFPVVVNDNRLGIVRVQKDYSDLYQRNLRFQSTVQGFAVALFIVIFIASVWMARAITRPIRHLTRRSVQVAEGNLNVVIQPSTRDELGELARSFQVMVDRVRSQIDVIERDRDEVRFLQARSKAFFDNVTHELKTPLTTILGYAQIIKDNGFHDPVFFEKGLDHIIGESNRLHRMVADILELAAAAPIERAYRMDEVDLSELVAEACEDMQIKADKYEMDIRYEADKQLFVRGDRDKLKEVLLNLLDNAIKYGHVRSTVTVKAWREGGYCCLVVNDRSDGISGEVLEQMFEPFFRGGGQSGERGSAGLGLAIVKTIVEDHGGTVTMTSRLQEGSTAEVQLPELEVDHEQH
ncbi:two-component sensor histidine kinase [Paenibacillus sp. 598K]|uniref:sensor histidine kinase n=1 Tax=Paenibacillus sp. 598K TaxID=1117987 RepID=UPI000FF938CA|nr:HAMP domain-containing sensor histidine kinase [Paenibacillus sp. 598K]GBF77161.1 two-component sensor histidine kinase [Paenibacillus sp. 598K]